MVRTAGLETALSEGKQILSLLDRNSGTFRIIPD